MKLNIKIIAIAIFILISIFISFVYNVYKNRNSMVNIKAPVYINIEIGKSFINEVKILALLESGEKEFPLYSDNTDTQTVILTASIDVGNAAPPFIKKIFLQIPKDNSNTIINSIKGISIFIGNKLIYFSQSDINNLNKIENTDCFFYEFNKLEYKKSFLLTLLNKKTWINWYGDINFLLKTPILFLYSLINPGIFFIIFIIFIYICFSENKTIKNKTIYSGLFFTTLYICLGSCLNPFFQNYIDTDTSVFLTITQGITRGYVPFRDFYDNKGPLLYLMSVPGYVLGKLTGVWLTELILMCVSVFFAFKTALFFGNRKFAYIGTILGFIVFQSFFYEVAGTEEFSMPFMMISMYIFTKHYFMEKKVTSLEIIILGFCFASTILLRINLFTLWFGFCIIIIIISIIKKDFLELIRYILLFLTGIAIIFIPILFYLISNDALNHYINQNFITGSSRGLSGFSIQDFIDSIFIIIGKNLCITPLLAGFVWITKRYYKINYSFSFLLAYIMTVIFHAVIRTNYDHYNMTLTPYLIPAFTFFCVYLYNNLKDIKYSRIYFLLIIFIVFSPIWIKGKPYLHLGTSHTIQNLIISGKIIDEYTNEGDKIISLGFPCKIYLFTQRDTASKYIYQTSGVNYEKNAQNEFIEEIIIKKPVIIVIENINNGYYHLPEWYLPIYEIIENEYELITDKHDYFIFKLKA